jgi:hypothetical protein
MGRKKTVAVVEMPTAGAEFTEDSTPVVREQHQVVRRWVEEKTMDEIADTAADLVEEPIEPPDPIAEAACFISGSSSTWSIGVERLKNYSRDKRTSPDARSFCGNLAIPDADYLNSNTYREDIQARWAKPPEVNFFLLALRKDNRIFRWLPVVAIDPPDPVTVAKQAAENANVNILYPYPQPQDGLRQFVHQARQFSEVRELLFPGAAVQPAAAPQINSTEQAMFHLLNADGGVVETIADKLRGLLNTRNDGSREPSMMDIGLALAQKFDLQAVLHEARALVAEARGNPVASQPAPMQPLVATPATPPPLPEAANQMINFTLHAVQQGWPPEQAAQWLIEFEAKNPDSSTYLDLIVKMEPDKVLTWLAQAAPQAATLAARPETKVWLEAVQKLLKESEVQDEAINQAS